MNTPSNPPASPFPTGSKLPTRFSPTLQFHSDWATKAFPGAQDWTAAKGTAANSLRSADTDYWHGLGNSVGAGGVLGGGLGTLVGMLTGHPLAGLFLGGLAGLGAGAWHGHQFGSNEAQRALNTGAAGAANTVQ